MYKQKYQPSRVIQIVSGNRSGSTLLKSILANSPSLTSLDGEEEAYIQKAGNGYGRNATSDAFTEYKNIERIQAFIDTELFTRYPWEWRLSLQYQQETLDRLFEDIISNGGMPPGDPIVWLRNKGVLGHYDAASPEERIPFKEMMHEMPPFVLPTVRDNDPTDTLLLKCPYNLYRPGIMEQVFPNSEFTYVIMARNPAAMINGLIDGWLAPYGFHKYQTQYGWWKFDMPRDWQTVALEPTAKKAAFQWRASAVRLLECIGDPNTNKVTCQFEDIMFRPAEEVNRLCRLLGIEPPEQTDIHGMPLIMATETPRPGRWKKRESLILQEITNKGDFELTDALGYRNKERWL